MSECSVDAETWVSMLFVVLLALSAAFGFVAYRSAPIDIVRWFLPPGVALSELSGLSLSSRGGSIDLSIYCALQWH